MTRPEFRKRSEGSTPSRAGEPGLAGSPFSRAQILHLMKNEFARARRYGLPVACLTLQVDRLASLIDIHGSALRERLRDRVAALVADNTRGHDLLGVMDDDRYLLVLPHSSEADATIVGERILESFNRLEVQVGGHVLALSMSVGLVACSDQDTMFFDTFLAKAEVALEAAVEAGGGQISVFRKEQASRGPTVVDSDSFRTPPDRRLSGA